MRQEPIESIRGGRQIRLDGEDVFVTVDYVAERFYEPGIFNLWIVGDKFPTPMRRGDLVEVQW